MGRVGGDLRKNGVIMEETYENLELDFELELDILDLEGIEVLETTSVTSGSSSCGSCSCCGSSSCISCGGK